MLSIFYPSVIKDEIYNIMDEYLAGSDIYEEATMDAIHDYFKNEEIEYTFDASSWPNMDGGTAVFAWVENGHAQIVIFDYREAP